MLKNVVKPERPQITSQYGAYALHAGLTRLYERIRMHTLTRPGIYMHASTHAHIEQEVILIAFPRQKSFSERGSVSRYTYIACLVNINYVLSY
jgi:hypothetical protein